MDTIYHYCSTKNFVSIVTSRSLQLSAVRLANDSMEGRLVGEVVSRLAREDGLDEKKFSGIKSIANQVEELFDGLCFCLSEKRDLLSQWRGYADNATGVAIGFSLPYLNKLSRMHKERLELNLPGDNKPGFGLAKVVYKTEHQNALVRPAYNEILRLFESGKLGPLGRRGPSDTRTEGEIAQDDEKIRQGNAIFTEKTLDLFGSLFLLKGHAFEEEAEWRLVSPEVSFPVDQDCCYRAQGDRIVPFRAYKLDLPDESPINEVMLGPRHQTPKHIVEEFVRKNGFGKVAVHRSSATYR